MLASHDSKLRSKAARRWFKVMAAVVLVATAAVLLHLSGRNERAIREALANYCAAINSGDKASIFLATGPDTLAWHLEMRDAAISEGRAKVQQRSVLDMTTILDLRSRLSRAQIQSMTDRDLLADYLRNEGAEQQLILSRVRVSGDSAIARLETPGKKPGQKLFIGEGEFFSRHSGVWYFERRARDEAIMSKMTSSLPRAQLLKIVTESVQAESGRFNDRWWDAPAR